MNMFENYVSQPLLYIHYSDSFRKLTLEENRRDTQEWTIQEHKLHWAHEGAKTNKAKNRTQKIKKSNTDPTMNTGTRERK